MLENLGKVAIKQVPNQDTYSPWGEAFAAICHQVGPDNVVHMDPIEPPFDVATSSVSTPGLILDPTITNITPQDYAAQFRAGNELYTQGRYAQAVECLHTADRLRPGQADCVVMIANCYQSLGQDSKAEGIYKFATEINPHHAIAWYNRGLTLLRLGRLEEARDCHLNAIRDRYLTGNPALEGMASSLAGILIKLRDTKSAKRLLTETIAQLGGRHSALANQLADCAADDGDPGLAIDVLRKQHPDDIESWFETATAPIHLNDAFRQSDFLSRIITLANFSLPKSPKLQDGFANALKSAIAKLKAESSEPFSVLELDGLGMYSIMCLQEGVDLAAVRVKSWTTLNLAIRECFTANGFAPNQAQIQEYVPSASGAEEPLAELPPNCKLVVQGVNNAASVPLLLSRISQFQAAGITTVPRKGTLKIMAIQCDQLYNQTNVGPIVSGFDVSNFGDFCTAIRKYNLSIDLSFTEHVQLSEVVSVDVDDSVDKLFRKKIILPMKTTGRIDAIATWYDFDLGVGPELSMGPSCGGLWKQNIQMVHLDDEIKAGADLEMEFVITRWAKDASQQWIMFDKIHDASAKTADVKVHETSLGSVDALGGAVWHFDMMSDYDRNDAYEAALVANVKPDDIVLDIGTGSGLLAMMACRAGAKHVYACEMNPEMAEKAKAVIKANGLEDKITVYGMRSTDLQIGTHLPTKANVVVTETMGTDFLSEAMYFSLDDARQRLMVEGGVMIPESGRVLAQLVSMDAPEQMDGFPKNAPINLSPLNKLLPNFWTTIQMGKTKYTPLSDVVSLFDIDFKIPLVKKGLFDKLSIPCTKAGSLNAVMIWWDSVLGNNGKDIIIETGPNSRYATTDHAHWSEMVQVLDQDGIAVKPGDKVPLTVYTDNHLTYCELPKAFRNKA